MQELTKNYKEFEEKNEVKDITKENIEKNLKKMIKFSPKQN
jgi:hypothetical protein